MVIVVETKKIIIIITFKTYTMTDELYNFRDNQIKIPFKIIAPRLRKRTVPKLKYYRAQPCGGSAKNLKP